MGHLVFRSLCINYLSFYLSIIPSDHHYHEWRNLGEKIQIQINLIKQSEKEIIKSLNK